MVPGTPPSSVAWMVSGPIGVSYLVLGAPVRCDHTKQDDQV